MNATLADLFKKMKFLAYRYLEYSEIGKQSGKRFI